MKKVLSVLVLLLAIHLVRAQVPPRDSLIGVWVCKETSLPEGAVIPQSEQEPIKKMREALLSCRFEFRADGLFYWQIPKSPTFEKELGSFLNGQNWQIDQLSQTIIIGEAKENLMQIMIYSKEGSTYFVMVDIPVVLHMEKER